MSSSDSPNEPAVSRSRGRWRPRRLFLAAAALLACLAATAAILLLRGKESQVPDAVRIERFTALLTGPGGAYMRTAGKPDDAVVDEWLDFKTGNYKQNPDVESDFRLIIVSGPEGTSTYNPYGKLVERRASERVEDGLLIQMHEAAQAKALRKTQPIPSAKDMTTVELRDPRKLEAGPILIVAIDDRGIPRKAQARVGDEASDVHTIEKFKTLSQSEARRQTRLGKLPKDTERTVDRAITVAELRRYRGFTTYWLGERTLVGRVTTITYTDGTDMSPLVYVAYGTVDDPYVIELNERDANSKEGRDHWNVTRDVTRHTVRGYPAKLQSPDGQSGVLIIKTPSTVIDISGGGERAGGRRLLGLARKQLQHP